MTDKLTYTPTKREKEFLDSVESPKYQRDIANGLNPFFSDKAPEEMQGFYTTSEIDALRVLKDTDRDVEHRMPVKMTNHYFNIAKNSKAVQKIVKASPEETEDLCGSEDPGYQMDYSPVEGLLHKYEMGLMYVISTCSSHCRHPSTCSPSSNERASIGCMVGSPCEQMVQARREN